MPRVVSARKLYVFNKGTKRAPHESDDEAQPFQRRSSHSISQQVFAALSRSSDDRVGSPYRCHMSEAVEKKDRIAGASAVAPRLFVLELNAGRIHSTNTDCTDRKTIVAGCLLPDGIVVDAGLARSTGPTWACQT